MTKIILSTSNIMNTGPSLIGRRPTFEKSNTEFTNSLRANFAAAAQAFPASQSNGKSSSQWSIPLWAQLADGMLYIPCPTFAPSPLAEPRPSYDITAKLFFLPSASSSPDIRAAHAREAMSLVLTALDAPALDLLIVSFPGISFDADDDSDELSDLPSGSAEAAAEEARIREMAGAWATGVEGLVDAGTVRQVGVAEFGSERLRAFLPLTKIRPSVDQINVRDCCVVPKSLILFAKEHGIELLTHNDCTDILPKGTLRELLSGGERGAGVLAEGEGKGLRGDIVPQWVVKYTAVVRDRGVIENKGYFAVAEVKDG